MLAQIVDSIESQSKVNRKSTETQSTLGDRKSEILNYLEANERATTSEIAMLLGVTSSWVRTIIRQMVEDGLIEKVGNNRYAYYALKSREAKRSDDG